MKRHRLILGQTVFELLPPSERSSGVALRFRSSADAERFVRQALNSEVSVFRLRRLVQQLLQRSADSMDQAELLQTVVTLLLSRQLSVVSHGTFVRPAPIATTEATPDEVGEAVQEESWTLSVDLQVPAPRSLWSTLTVVREDRYAEAIVEVDQDWQFGEVEIQVEDEPQFAETQIVAEEDDRFAESELQVVG